MSATDSVLIVGMGNTLRGDDSVGVGVAEALERLGLPGVRVVAGLDEGLSLINAWEGARRVYVFDAVSSGRPAGHVHRLDAHRQALPAELFNCSTHSFSLPQAIELARVLNRLPPQLIVYGIEGSRFGRGEPLSPAVAGAMQTVIDAVADEIGRSTA